MKCPPPSVFRVGEVFEEFGESCPQLRLFRLHKSLNTPSQTRVTWPFGRIFWLPYVLLLLLVFETFKLRNNWLTNLLGTVLQVEAESICALTIFDFVSWTRCKWATNFFAHPGVALHSATNSSLSASSSTQFDCWLPPVCFLVPPLLAGVKWPMIPHFLHFLPNAGGMMWWLPWHQNHSGVGGAEVWFSRVD